jgi:hypothetical protein
MTAATLRSAHVAYIAIPNEPPKMIEIMRILPATNDINSAKSMNYRFRINKCKTRIVKMECIYSIKD